MSETNVTPEDLQRWDELTRAALVRTNPQLERPIGRDMAIAEWMAACGTAMPALIAEVRQLTQRTDAAEAERDNLWQEFDALRQRFLTMELRAQKAEAQQAQLAQMQREIAGLRYYIAQLERNVSPEQREYAAQVAQMMLAEQSRP